MEKYSREYLLKTGIGLQCVDGLHNSSFFIKASKRYLNGEISLGELEILVHNYYKRREKCNSRENLIISLIKDNNKITLKDLSEKLEFSLGTIKNDIKKLESKKVLTRIHGKKFGYWKINI